MKSLLVVENCSVLYVLIFLAATPAHAYQKYIEPTQRQFEKTFLGRTVGNDQSLSVPNRQDFWLDEQRSGNEIDQSCLVTTQVGVHDEQGKHCPVTCPLYVQDRTDDRFCSFRCVPATIKSCAFYNPNAPVPDLDLGVCRACKVRGCSMCANDGTDTCLVCKGGHDLIDGKCHDHRRFMWYMVLMILGALVLLIVVWVINLSTREITNKKELDRGLATRSRAKLHKPRNPDDTKRELWPYSTALQETPVAGPAVTHMFSFEFALIAWAALVAIAWLFMAVFIDMDFLMLGTKDPGKTPRDHCIIVQWGFTTQSRLMSAKIIFVYALYIVSFLLAVLYGIFELRKHHRLHAQRCSHKDFCAKCVGLPCLSGNYKDKKGRCIEDSIKENINTFIKEHVQDSTSIKEDRCEVLGVSIAWDFQTEEDFLQGVIDYDHETRMSKDEDTNCSVDFRAADSIKKQCASEESMNWLTRLFVDWEKMLLAPSAQRVVRKKYEAHPSERSAMSRASALVSPRSPRSPRGAMSRSTARFTTDAEVCAKLGALKTTHDAFIIFNSEKTRDDVIAEAERCGGIDFQYVEEDPETKKKDTMTKTLVLTEFFDEPQAVNWANFGEKNLWLHMFLGLLSIFCALVVWCCCFYLPYAYSVMRADYAHGTDPNLFSRTMFGFIVVAGNAVMYVVCAEVSDRIGFKTRSEREVCYMLLYCFACVFNVLLDLGMSYQMAYKQMVGLGMKTYTGEHLSDVHSFSARFETYAMQKSLGNLLLDYAFPSTFLIPFLMEPIVVIYLPWKVMMLIVRTHPIIIGTTAEAYLAGTPMDLSRYADVILNVMLATLIFFFPGGYVMYMFVGLIVSHLFIYAYDRWRVLRAIPECDFATFDVEWWAQWLLSIPCGMLLSCAVFKSHCDETEECWNNKDHVVERCWLVFLAHVAVHTLILLYVIPLFCKRSRAVELKHGRSYRACSESLPCSFFSANPVHCLRSQYIHNHSPPFRYYVPGKDELLEVNEKIHAYYKAENAAVEEYSARKLYQEAVTEASHLSHNVAEFSHNFLDKVCHKKHDERDSSHENFDEAHKESDNEKHAERHESSGHESPSMFHHMIDKITHRKDDERQEESSHENSDGRYIESGHEKHAGRHEGEGHK